MPSRLDKTLLAIANVLIPIAILVFATGFFPYKPFMPGLAGWEDVGFKDVSSTFAEAKLPAPVFDKVVFMVVDALRSDFVFGEGSGFRFVQSLISSGYAIPFTAHATSPTITMPRVKAITTGSIPSFLDVILNFAESDTTSTLATQDTWLAQLKAQPDGKLVMYGDDTWLKLFPGFFEREDGTSSFFVADFTEVDDNVTRHVPEELLNSDWNGMILHYLGLDHIGHKAGPNSPNMLPKQREMDAIAESIYGAIEGEPHLESTLFVLAGDHGMNEGGNHGGSAPGETSPALVFMSPKLQRISNGGMKCPIDPKGEFEYYRKIEQSDIAPTLAGLLGFPVPLNNLGVFIPEFLRFWGEGERVGVLARNARQILRIVRATFPGVEFGDEVDESVECAGDLTSAEELRCKWQGVVKAIRGRSEDGLVLERLLDFCRTAQGIMSSTASNYDVSRLILGSALAFVSFALTLFVLRYRILDISSTGVFYTLTLILYAVLMFASSYVEEEHHFWYWTTSAWFAYLFVFDSRKQWFPKFFHPSAMLLLLHRLTRRWNQTGQKYAGAPDIAHSAFLHNSLVLWSLVGATYLYTTMRLSQHVARSISDPKDEEKEGRGREVGYEEGGEIKRLIGLAAVLPLGVVAFVFKLAFTARDAPELVAGVAGGLVQWVEGVSLVGTARLVFVGCGLGVVWVVLGEVRRRRSGGRKGNGDLAFALFDFLSLILPTQTRAQNIPLYLIFRMQLFFLSFLPLTPTQTTLTTLLLTHTSFFALGNSNAISSIDLSNSYNGVSGYNVVAVGILVFVSNWAGPIFWSAAGVLLVGVGERDGGRGVEGVSTSDGGEKRSWVREEFAHLGDLAVQSSSGTGLTPSSTATPDSGQSPFFWHITLQTLFTACSLVAVMTACTALRTHLFIWTVFSPKFLYAMAWGLAWHLGVSVGLGGGLRGVW